MTTDDDDQHRGSRAEWHPDTVGRLIHAYGDKCATIKGYLKAKDWEDILSYVNTQCEGSRYPKTMKQCREKVDSLKRRYKLERRRAEHRGTEGAANWSFYDRMDDIMRNLRTNIGEDGHSHSFEALDFQSFDDAKGSTSCLHGADDVLINADDADGFAGIGDEDDGEYEDVPYHEKKRHCIGFTEKRVNGNQGLSNSNPNPGLSDNAACGNMTVAGDGVDPVRALADALVRFSEIYAKAENAKMEVFQKMNYELSRIHRRRKKKKGVDSGVINGASGDSVDSEQM